LVSPKIAGGALRLGKAVAIRLMIGSRGAAVSVASGVEGRKPSAATPGPTSKSEREKGRSRAIACGLALCRRARAPAIQGAEKTTKAQAPRAAQTRGGTAPVPRIITSPGRPADSAKSGQSSVWPVAKK
jgi:hypothetical protein